MPTHSSSELAARLVQAVAPYLDDDEYRALWMALGTEPSRRVVAAVVAIIKQRHCVPPTDLAGGLADRRRPPGYCQPHAGAGSARPARATAATGPRICTSAPTMRR